jgi:hypothetical protein
MKIQSIFKGGKLYLMALALMGSSVSVSSAELTQSTIPKTELILDSGYTLTWAGGPLVKVCATGSTQCVTGKIPKMVGTFYGVSAYPNLAGAKASWITTSKTDSFMCSLALTAPTVTCAKIPAAPVKLVRVGMTVKVVTLDNSQAINETRNIMEGELGFAAMTSSTSSSTMSSCPRPNKPADEPGCVWEFNEDRFEWECIPEIVIIGVPEDEGCKPGEACWDDSCPFGEICDGDLPDDDLPPLPPPPPPPAPDPDNEPKCGPTEPASASLSFGGNSLVSMNLTNSLSACSCDKHYSMNFMANYPRFGQISQPDVWKQVGGNLEKAYGEKSPKMGDTCAVRASKGFNGSGGPKIAAGTKGANINYVDQGGDGMRYILSARNMNSYLHQSLGSPHRTISSILDVFNLEDSLQPNQIALVSSEQHVGIASKEYTDDGVRQFFGEVWLLEPGYCTCP